jgi:hypothetical protein
MPYITPEQIEKDYQVVDGIILSPGKFEFQPRYMPYFYEVYLDGLFSILPHGVISIEVWEEDKNLFSELRPRKRVRFIITEQGFVEEQ